MRKKIRRKLISRKKCLRNKKEKLLTSLKIMSESFRPDIFEFIESEEEKEFGKGDITWINVFED